MRLACSACSQVVQTDDLCPHRSPVCWACCADEHPWTPETDDPEGQAA